MNAVQKATFTDLGLIDFKEAWEYQDKLFSGIIQKKLANRDAPEKDRMETKSHLLFCEHPHVYTLGKTGSEQHLLLDKSEINGVDLSYHKINRGGDITYHGPGQVVVYPIFDLDNFFTDIGRYLRYLEEIVIRTLSGYGVNGGRIKGATGAWIDAEAPANARKICAIGVRTSRWVTMHGFALNVNTDLRYFDNIIPCGISDKAVTSLEKELGRKVDTEEVKEKLKAHFADLFNIELVCEPFLKTSP